MLNYYLTLSRIPFYLWLSPAIFSMHLRREGFPTVEMLKAQMCEPAPSVSGWYGPGVFVAWLISAHSSAISSIWNNKCSALNKEFHHIDAELLFVLFYPAVTLCDLFNRLTKFEMYPDVNATIFILSWSIIILGPANVLSRHAESIYELDSAHNRMKCLRYAASMIIQMLSYSMIIGFMHEPNGYRHLGLVLAVQLAVMIYAILRWIMLLNGNKYGKSLSWPRVERVVVFCVVQILFGIILYSMRHSIWPPTTISIWELDQWATLLSAIINTFYMRAGGIKWIWKEGRRYLDRFNKVRNDDGSTIELGEVVSTSLG